ncbi:dihydrofolate reductase [Pontibacillus halophilus JSM 076056 = DSM 19796]|uniref:Dihydrofolate reductase n=1 Tax=Pontibacillus halophilus JSM 076056 = DSM 19796 TaxID=1385510 RepID=A0A0A5GFF3_9BACI|nr:dihydrofolate reductase [Pontibacillus halophilus]KGX91946.1 dihydrofolate reductase [Pontibacillus halophilus JSM 076056 = DSM 19796]
MLSILVAMDRNRVIGLRNDLPWNIPNDLKYFKQVTMGRSIIMGRKTFESIGRVLPKRANIIVTTQPNYRVDGATIWNSLEPLNNLAKEEEHFIIGGSYLFQETLDCVDRLYVTWIDESFEGDTYFPDVDWEEWVLLEEQLGVKDEKNPYDYYFRVYEHKDRALS